MPQILRYDKIETSIKDLNKMQEIILIFPINEQEIM